MVMGLDKTKAIWLLISVALSMLAAFFSFKNAIHISNGVDTVASVLSILIGVSLAISTLLISPIQTNLNVADETKRLKQKVSKAADKKLLSGQYFVFLTYFVALIFALLVKHMIGFIGASEAPLPLYFKVSVSLYALTGTFSILWSAVLPSLLYGISIQRVEGI